MGSLFNEEIERSVFLTLRRNRKARVFHLRGAYDDFSLRGINEEIKRPVLHFVVNSSLYYEELTRTTFKSLKSETPNPKPHLP